MKVVVLMTTNTKHYKVVMGLLTIAITVLNLIEVSRTGSMGYAVYTGILACFATYYISKD